MAKKTASVAALAPNSKNPRKVTKAKLSMLQKSMAKFGDLGGIVVNRRSGQIVGGHQRREAFMALKADDITIERAFDSPTEAGTVAEGYVDLKGERFNYRETDWPADIEAAANLAANRGAGDFDMPMLADMMSELDTGGFEDMDLTMFDAQERASLLENVEQCPDEGGNSDDDKLPVLPAEPQTKPGDIYRLGRHRLQCGDSSNTQHIDSLMNGEKASVVYSDPPYGMAYVANHKHRPKGKGQKWTSANNFAPIIGDDKPFDPSFLLARFADAREIFLWGADYYCQRLPDAGSWIVWDKRTKADGEHIHQYKASEFELCWSREKHHREIARILWTGLCGVNEGKRQHPTQKPVELSKWFLSRFANDGDTVVDLYGGSGSTMLACEQQKCTCLMMEIDPGYCDVIVARWEKLTGQKAELLPRQE